MQLATLCVNFVCVKVCKIDLDSICLPKTMFSKVSVSFNFHLKKTFGVSCIFFCIPLNDHMYGVMCKPFVGQNFAFFSGLRAF